MAKKDITPRRRQLRGPYDFVPTAERNILGMQDMDLLARPHIVDLLSTEIPAPRVVHEGPAQAGIESSAEFASKLAMRSVVTGEAS